MCQGRYKQARAISGKPSWLLLPSGRLANDYNIAICLMHEGHLQDAMVLLERLAVEAQSSSKTLSAMVNGALASILLITRQAPRRAQMLLEEMNSAMLQPSFWMALALARQRAGSSSAAECVERAEHQKPWRVTFGSMTLFYWPQTVENAAFSVWRALYREERGEVAEAREDYERAAESSVPSIYRTIAQEKLSGELSLS